VDYALLRSWLGLLPGPWPPDHYTLLGFPVGQVPPAALEARVMERMDLLRRYQLLHPDLVTEGMNRLAQALITLTDPAGQAAYDAGLNVTSPSPSQLVEPASPAQPENIQVIPFVVAEPVFDDDVFADDEPPGERSDTGEMTQIIEVAGTSGAVVPYEVVPDEARPLPVAVEYVEPAEPRVVEAEVLELPGPVAVPVGPEGRRWIYARLALLRRALRAWDRLRPVIADPQDPFDRVARIVILLEAVQAVRPLLPALRGVIGRGTGPGALVATLCGHSFVLDTLRRLLPDQRQLLAADWHHAREELQREYARLRRLARERNYTPGAYRRVPAFVRWLQHVPELLLIGLAVFAMLVAIVQTLRR
jgi:hypothetical protein